MQNHVISAEVNQGVRDMRKLLFGCALSALAAMPAMAADLSVKAPVRETMAEPPFSWTGFYIGGHAGGGWSHKCFFEHGRPEGCTTPMGGSAAGKPASIGRPAPSFSASNFRGARRAFTERTA